MSAGQLVSRFQDLLKREVSVKVAQVSARTWPQILTGAPKAWINLTAPGGQTYCWPLGIAAVARTARRLYVGLGLIVAGAARNLSEIEAGSRRILLLTPFSAGKNGRVEKQFNPNADKDFYRTRRMRRRYFNEINSNVYERLAHFSVR